MKKLLAVLSLMTIISCSLPEDTKTGNRLLVAGDKYYVCYEDEVVELNEDTYITTEKKMGDYFYNFLGKGIKNERKLLFDISKYFPHGIDIVVKGEKPKNFVNMPTMKLTDKNIIDSIKLANLLGKEDGKALINVNTTSDIVNVKDTNQVDPEVSLSGKKVEILNANGINGFAAKLGQAFKDNLNMEFNAENYTKSSSLSYVINHKLSEKEFNKFVNSISLKYIKILEDNTIKPDADVVIITGDDNKVTDFKVTIKTKNGVSELQELLKEYKPVIVKDDKMEANKIVIKHKKEDLIIAKKMLSYIPEAELVVDETVNGIEIVSTR